MRLRWSEEEYARYMGLVLPTPEPLPAAISEEVWQATVLKVAKDAGWTFAYHTYRSTKSLGGFPDLILCHREPGHVCYAVELKTETGIVSEAQQAWLAALAGCTGVVAEVWRPAQMQDIMKMLRGA